MSFSRVWLSRFLASSYRKCSLRSTYFIWPLSETRSETRFNPALEKGTDEKGGGEGREFEKLLDRADEFFSFTADPGPRRSVPSFRRLKQGTNVDRFARPGHRGLSENTNDPRKLQRKKARTCREASCNLTFYIFASLDRPCHLVALEPTTRSTFYLAL